MENIAHGWLFSLIGRCQGVAGVSCGMDSFAALQVLDDLLRDVPETLSTPEVLLTVGLLTNTLHAFSKRVGLHRDPKIRELILELATTGSATQCLQQRWLIVIRTLNTLLTSVPGPVRSTATLARLNGILETIRARCDDPRLTLRSLARESGSSSEHVCRLLRQHTGIGFVLHRHHNRIYLAQTLLRDTTVSIKEIAYRCGYRSTASFDHWFRRFAHQTPTTYRTQEHRGVK